MQSVTHASIERGSRSDHLPSASYSCADRLFHSFLGIFSAKQATRPDSIFTCCRQVMPYLKQALAQEYWKVVFVMKHVLHISEDLALKNCVLAIEAIHRMETAIEENRGYEITLSWEEKAAIEQLLSSPLSDSAYFKLNAYLVFLKKDKLWKTVKAYRELFKPLQDNSVCSLQRKIADIDRLNESLDAPFSEENKLTPKDIRLLLVAPARTKLLDALKKFEIRCPQFQGLDISWKTLQTLNQSEVVQQLTNRCREGHKSGRVYFYDWSFIEIRDFGPFSFTEIVQHIFCSRIPHVSIVVHDSQHQTSLSHVNGAMGTHGMHPVRYPLMGSLGNFAELDIVPLLPSNVSPDHQTLLQKTFSDAFVRFASELHPNISLDEMRLFFLGFFCGHKGLTSHDLSEIDLTTKQSQLCSSYVGAIFLKAVHEVNQELSRLGYEEKIKHPFGEHEILNRMDILRLLYHWKQLKVMKVVPVDAFVAKVIAAPTL